MEAQDYWQEYVGDESPLEFMGRYESNNPERCVAKYMDRLPDFFGIVRRRTWDATFAQEDQLRKEPVAGGLLAHLETTRENWEPALADYRKNRPRPAQAMPEPEPEQAPADQADSEDTPHEHPAEEHAEAVTQGSTDTERSVDEEIENLPDLPEHPKPEVPSEN